MGQPIWQIRAQNLGTIAENIFFEYELEAIDTDTQPVTYSLIAGTLPAGIQLTGTAISGIPIKITGVPAGVDADTSSRFSIRATTTTNEVSDITLDLTVSGQSAPVLLTAAGELGQFYYGDYIDLQLDAVDSDIGNTISWNVINDTLPDGLTLTVDPDDDRIAYIRGYPVPATALPPGVVLGFDAQLFDEDLGAFGFDFGLNTVDKSFEFIISITDGIGFDSATYSVFLQSRLTYTADNDIITVDNVIITADQSPGINPTMETQSQYLGMLLHDNYFTFLFEADDFEGNQIEYLIDSGTIPPSLTLDPDTGWLYGNLDIIPTASESYTFTVVARKVFNPEFVSDPVTFTMTVVSDLANSLIVNSPLIMTINNGEISELFIDASANTGSVFELNADSTAVTADQLSPTTDTDTDVGSLNIAVDYTLVSGQLPVGLALTRDGLIIGRPFFTHFTLDQGTTTFDEGTTTFDGTYTFDVQINDVTLGVITQIQTFSIIVNPTNLVPYENLYLVSRPTLKERATLRALADNETVIPRENVYRNNDLYFGVAPDLRFLMVNGLPVATRVQYATILESNHYTRRFSFSDLKIAKAVGDDGNPSYELIYADVVDRLENLGKSVAPELVVDGVDLADLTTRVPPATPQYDSQGNIIIRPASLDNMRATVIGEILFTADNYDQDTYSADMDTITADATMAAGLGQQNINTLPDWMTTTQDDGRILGYIPAVPLVYCLPGEASQILFDINQSGFNINEISFDVDRYVWDNNLTKISGSYFLTLSDTQANFDGIDPNGSFVGGDGFLSKADSDIVLADNDIITADSNTAYVPGDTITLSNGAVLTVIAVDGNGDVTEFEITVTTNNLGADTTAILADSDIFTADFGASAPTTSNVTLTQASTSGTGVGFTLTPIRPADQPDINDEILKFPKTNVFQ